MNEKWQNLDIKEWHKFFGAEIFKIPEEVLKKRSLVRVYEELCLAVENTGRIYSVNKRKGTLLVELLNRPRGEEQENGKKFFKEFVIDQKLAIEIPTEED